MGWRIKATGQVVGSSEIAGDLASHAVRWTGTTQEDLGTLGGTNSYGSDINNSGQVAGSSKITGDGSTHAVRWTGSTPTDLGTLGGPNSIGLGINANGDVIGMSYLFDDGSPDQDAFLYTGGMMYDLNNLLVPGSGVTSVFLGLGGGINDFGQIATYGNIAGQMHALLLTPTPEPASAVLLLGGAALLGLRRRR